MDRNYLIYRSGQLHEYRPLTMQQAFMEARRLADSGIRQLAIHDMSSGTILRIRNPRTGVE